MGKKRSLIGLGLVCACGLLALGCPANKRCEATDERFCTDDATYRVDSCGDLIDLLEQCQCGCNSMQSGCVKCDCTADCEGKECGDDGCGDFCGHCSTGEICDAGGQCVRCTPDCAGKECGDDGCGGSCGSCDTDETCQSGRCSGSSLGENCDLCTQDADCSAGLICTHFNEAPEVEFCSSACTQDEDCTGPGEMFCNDDDDHCYPDVFEECEGNGVHYVDACGHDYGIMPCGDQEECIDGGCVSTTPPLTTEQLVVGAWFGGATCSSGGNTVTIEYGYFICPTGRLRGFESIGGWDFVCCGTWSVSGDRLTADYKATAVADPSVYEYVTWEFDYDAAADTLTWVSGCPVPLHRLAGEITEDNCTSSACTSGGSGSMQCGTDCDCGRCWYCESGTCRYGGEGPYGCYRGCGF